MRHVFTHELRSLPAWLLQAYLIEAGGTPGSEGVVTGPGWQARLTPMGDFVIGSIRVGQVRLEWEGDDQALQATWPIIEQKIMRAGG